MKFLNEIDPPKSDQWINDAAACAFVDEVVFPTRDRAEALVRLGRILAGGSVASSVALRFNAEVDSSRQLDELVSSLPRWSVATTRVTALIEFSDRRFHLQALLQRRSLLLRDETHLPTI